MRFRHAFAEILRGSGRHVAGWTFPSDDDNQIRMSLPELARNGSAAAVGSCLLLGKSKADTSQEHLLLSRSSASGRLCCKTLFISLGTDFPDRWCGDQIIM